MRTRTRQSPPSTSAASCKRISRRSPPSAAAAREVAGSRLTPGPPSLAPYTSSASRSWSWRATSARVSRPTNRSRPSRAPARGRARPVSSNASRTLASLPRPCAAVPAAAHDPGHRHGSTLLRRHIGDIADRDDAHEPPVVGHGHGAPGVGQDVVGRRARRRSCRAGPSCRRSARCRRADAPQALLEDELLDAGRCGVVQEPGDGRGPQAADEAVRPSRNR